MWTYLGQNFLKDSKTRNYIADKISDLYKKLDCGVLIEIWPWKWAITKLINQISDNFIVIEKDVQLAESIKLKAESWELNLKKIINSDVLEVNVEDILKEMKLNSEQTLVVWNLPYYITSPILRKFFWNWECKFPWWIFMLQNEVWEKIKSDAKKKSYLWWLLNYWYDVTYLKMVPAKAFSPIPKVKSCLVKLEIKNSVTSYGASEKLKIEWDKLLNFLDLYSGFSRKTLGSIQKILVKHWLKTIPPLRDSLYSDSGCKKTPPEWQFKIPENLKKNRLEELGRNEIIKIVN